jgi:glycosyltransferase involved in cell wall biosynthesis
VAGEINNESDGPFRIGVFWESQIEVVPVESRTHFLSTLINGLLSLDEPLEIKLFVRPEDWDATASLRCQSGGRLRLVSFLGGSGRLPGRESFPRKAARRLVAVDETREIVGRWSRRARSLISSRLRTLLSAAQGKLRKSAAAGWALLLLGGSLAAGIVLVCWILYFVLRLGMAVWRCLFFPARMGLKIDAFRRTLDRVRLSLDPLILAKEAKCDVWLIPSLTFPHSLQNIKAAKVVMIPSVLESVISPEGSELSAETVDGIASCLAAEASICVRLSLTILDRHVESVLQLDPAKVRVLPLVEVAGKATAVSALHPKSRKQAAQAWLETFHEAVDIARWRSTLDHQLVKPWPRLETLPPSPGEPLKVFLFLPQAYYGGVLQVTRELVSELAAVNGLRGRLHLTLGLLENQGSTQFLKGLDKAVDVQRMRLNPIRRREVIRLCGGLPPWLADRPEQEFCFMSGATQAAFDADAWFSLVDRFPLALLPARPLGILVHDVIQRIHPEIFDMEFFRSMSAGIIPTARSADAIVAMTPQTRDDVIAAYGVDPARVRLIPVACNPEWHFSQTTPRPVHRIREPFILNVTNCSPHKGADVILRAYALLKHRLGSATPLLVLCGFMTEGFSQTQEKFKGLPWETIQRLVLDLDLVESQDVVFLGTVNDDQLHYLYQHCRVVVNAARYDNGCLCLAEGAYFGRPAISSRYAAAEFHAQRFGYPARFFPIGDAEALAESLVSAIQEPPATPEDINRARSRFHDPEFSFRRYGERIYDLLVQMAEKGRSQQSTGELRISA